MFQTRILPNALIKLVRNQFEKKIESCFQSKNPVSFRSLSSHQNFSRNHITSNGFHSPYLTKAGKFGKSRQDFSKLSDEKCWKCKQFLEPKKITCSTCGVLQHPKKNVNYFELFGVSQSFNVDYEILSKKFKSLQMNFHPDKFANKSKEELEISEMYSRLLNKAYTTLKDPLRRGFYLLEMQKIDVESMYPLDQDFLLSIMEKNEQLNCITTEKQLKTFSKANNEDISDEIQEITDAFQTRKYDDAKIHLFKLNYYVNIENKIKEKLASFEKV